MIVCKECGNAAPSTDGFCSSCGSLLEWSGQHVEAVLSGAAMPTEHSAAAEHIAVGIRPDDEAVRPAPTPIPVDPRLGGLFCSQCGTRNAEGRTFCRYCGEPLDLTVSAPRRLRWWQRLFARHPRRGPAAGDRPTGFRGRDAKTTRRRGLHLPRLPLSKLAPVLVVLGVAGIGVGPGRQWVTQRFDTVFGKAKQHVTATYVPVVPVSATASSAASAHKSKLVVDGVKDTWWQSADHPGGIGESVTIRFANPVDIDRIGVLCGEPGGKYRIQARPRTVNVTADGKPGGQISFTDKADFQNSSVTLRQVRSVTLVVTASYPGQKGHAVAIRELQFFQQD